MSLTGRSSFHAASVSAIIRFRYRSNLNAQLVAVAAAIAAAPLSAFYVGGCTLDGRSVVLPYTISRI